MIKGICHKDLVHFKRQWSETNILFYVNQFSGLVDMVILKFYNGCLWQFIELVM